jgi:RNA polymerase sigma-70 factor (ECF subfamily)
MTGRGPAVRLSLDDEAFHAFYAETAPALHRYARRVSGDASVADDVLQESYLRLLQADITVTSSPELRGYLFRIATNLLNDHFRSARRFDPSAAGEGADALCADPALDRAADLRRGLRRLQPRERQLLWLAYAEGSTHREIAAATGLRPSSIRTLLFRARHRLAALLVRGT